MPKLIVMKNFEPKDLKKSLLENGRPGDLFVFNRSSFVFLDSDFMKTGRFEHTDLKTFNRTPQILTELCTGSTVWLGIGVPAPGSRKNQALCNAFLSGFNLGFLGAAYNPLPRLPCLKSSTDIEFILP